jgi:COP9 signalosome complex subunit 5
LASFPSGTLSANQAALSTVYDNNVELVDEKRDGFYGYDQDAVNATNDERAWTQDPNHFKHVRVSAIALIKMTMHARSGGDLEIMGLMQGYTVNDTIIVTDAFRLPVEGTETRVNAQNEANEYIIAYLEKCREQGRHENVVGWYHSHPGYGCWLSGIDVETQALQQKFQDPCCAIVIDPDRTISGGKVEIGAFRTYPEGHKPSNAGTTSSSTAVPTAKAADFGAHADRYYSLEVSHFKTTLDTQLLEQLWHKYWVQTLGQNPMFTNREYGNKQLLELSSTIKEAAKYNKRKNPAGLHGTWVAPNKAGDKATEKLVQDARQIASQEKTAMIAHDMKAQLFNNLVSKDS